MPIDDAPVAEGRLQAGQTGVDPAGLRRLVAALLCHEGLAHGDADQVADALVDADQAGIASHGVMLMPMYLERLRAGSISRAPAACVVVDSGSVAVLDAGHMFGQISSAQAVTWLQTRAHDHGLAAVAVRNAFHFGAAGRWAARLAGHGLVGVAMSNTRPLMPAPGGAERVVGNNPLAIALPTGDGIPLVVDMALSASAMGKIRLAATSGTTLPDGWAVDAAGNPTTDPLKALEGMLLPTGGAKGYGLAVMIDLLCAGLSSGALGGEVQKLYGDPGTPYGCAHFFLAIDIKRFVPLDEFKRRADAFADRMRHSARAHGTDRLYSPGERSWAARQRHARACPVDVAVLQGLRELALAAGLDVSNFFQS